MDVWSFFVHLLIAQSCCIEGWDENIEEKKKQDHTKVCCALAQKELLSL